MIVNKPGCSAEHQSPFGVEILGTRTIYGSMQHIRVRGARTHNLKNLSLDLPRERLIVVTGL